MAHTVADVLVDEACRHARNHRGVAHITFPVDYQEKKPTGETSMHKRAGHASSRWSPPLALPREDDLRLAAFLLNESKRPVILVGRGSEFS
jgi:pyruvate dehydrogenase (quinone)